MKTKQYALCLIITQVEVDDDDDGFENDKYPTLSTHDTLQQANDALIDVMVLHDESKAFNFLEKNSWLSLKSPLGCTRKMNNTTLTFNRIEDPGHSWLEVPVKMVRDIAGVFDQITDYSPIAKGNWYLEEDCDLYTFYKAMTDKGYTIKWNTVHVNDFDDYYRSIKRSY